MRLYERLNKKKITIKAGIVCLLIAIVGGVVCNYLYNHTLEQVPISMFQRKMHQKERLAQFNLKKIAAAIKTSNNDIADIVQKIDIEKLNYSEIFYYIIEDQNLLFWSDNQLDITSIDLKNLTTDAYVELNNATCVAKTEYVGDYLIVALIKIKNSYTVNNRYIKNDFAEGFWMDRYLVVEAYSPESRWAVRSLNGAYLFSLNTDISNIKSNLFLVLSNCFWTLVLSLYILLFVLIGARYNKGIFGMKLFWIPALLFNYLPFLVLSLGYPSSIFDLDMFKPLYFSSGFIFQSLGHLLLFAFLVLIIFLVYNYKAVNTSFVKIKKGKLSFWVVELITIVLSIFYLYIFRSLAFNAAFDFFIIFPKEHILLGFIARMVLILIFVLLLIARVNLINKFKYFISNTYILVCNIVSISLAVALFFIFDRKDYDTLWMSVGIFVMVSVTDMVFFFSTKKLTFNSWGGLILLYSIFNIWYAGTCSSDKQFETSRTIADNLAVQSDSTIVNALLHKTLNTFERSIASDPNIEYFLSIPENRDNPTRLSRYIVKYYFTGILSDQYTPSFRIISKQSNEYNDAMMNIERNEIKRITQYFYINENSSDKKPLFLGLFPFSEGGTDEQTYILCSIRQNIKSPNYGYPDIIFENRINSLNLMQSTAKYVNGVLVNNSGEFSYPYDNNYMPKVLTSGESAYVNGHLLYTFIYPNDTRVVIGIKQPPQATNIALMFTYMFSLSLLLLFLLRNRIYYYPIPLESDNAKSFTLDIQKAFAIFIFLSLMAVFSAISVFVYNQYRDNQINNLTEKSQYISAELQQFFSNEKIDELSIDHLNELKEKIGTLSRKYESDMHIYNTEGQLLATSRSYIFSKGLSSTLISSIPYFEKQSEMLPQIEHLGRLKYYSLYRTLYDFDNTPVAIVAVPSFFSILDLQSEITSFIAVLINIYLIIFIATSFLSNWLSRRLSNPLREIEDKLKSISLGKKNEKIGLMFKSGDKMAVIF